MKSFLRIGNGVYFSRSQRLGVVVLLFVISCVQLLFYVGDSFDTKETVNVLEENIEVIEKLDSICLALERMEKSRDYTFNPNFIENDKSYFLGMSVQEYDRLRDFREQGKFVNSGEEFQKVTGVSDAWMEKYGVRFKFPDWVTKRANSGGFSKGNWHENEVKTVIEKVDINTASKEKLIAVRGIGDALSDRILSEREKFGAFVSVEQFDYIWGLKSEVIEELKKHFVVMDTASKKKVNINTAGRNELKLIPYLNYGNALEIIKHRSLHGDFETEEDLKEIKNIPLDKLAIINLYLDF